MNQKKETTPLREMHERFRERLAVGAFAGKEVWCFGHADATLQLLRLFDVAGISVRGILDNNEAKQGQVVCGVPIVAPEAFLRRETAGTVVCIVSRAYAAMARQLAEGGFRGTIEKLADYNTFAAYSLHEDVRKEKAERLERGQALWRTLRQEHPAPFYFVLPFAAIGDVCHAMAYLDAYCAREGIRERCVVVTGEAERQTVALYGDDAVVCYPQAQMDELVQGVMADRPVDVRIVHHDRPYSNYMIQLLRTTFLPFDAFYRCGVYGLPQNTTPARPVHFAEPEDFHGIVPGRKVILSPYAKSVAGMPLGFWEAEAAHWQAEGNLVYTNTAWGETPIPGTRPLDVPVRELGPLVKRAGTFVARRSGLCELLDGIPCRKIVYFPDVHYSDTPWHVADFFHMPGWENIVVREDGSKMDAGNMGTFHAAKDVDF